jgi:Cys-tRNA(Pro) deacylase
LGGDSRYDLQLEKSVDRLMFIHEVKNSIHSGGQITEIQRYRILPPRELNVPEHSIIKTLVMEDDKKSPIIVLMHGDRQVSTKSLARQTGARAIYSCNPEVANKHSGYLVGGTSPFGTKKTMPVYLERTILDLDEIYINGGSRGFLLSMSPGVLLKLLNPVVVEVGIDG